jgi:hypothetical protein
VDLLAENPVVAVVVAVLVLGFVGHRVWRWRRESAMSSHAGEHGWRQVRQVETFADLAVGRFPELRERAEQDARSARSPGGRRGAFGSTIRVGRSPGGASDARARNAFVVPTQQGEVAVGEVTVAGKAGKASQSRASVHRSAAVARIDEHLPRFKLLGRAWVDRDSGGDLPDELTARFNDQPLDPDQRAALVDSDAYRVLLESTCELDGVAVDGDRIVLLGHRQLDPERAADLAETTAAFARRLVAAEGHDADATATRLRDPLAVG